MLPFNYYYKEKKKKVRGFTVEVQVKLNRPCCKGKVEGRVEWGENSFSCELCKPECVINHC